MRVLDVGAQRLATCQQSDNKAQAQRSPKRAPKFGPNGALQRVWPYSGATKTLDRPFTTISGRRRVPKLVNANRVPFLRLKKPQSPFLSRIIRDTVATREKRITLANQLTEQLPIAVDEDKWDQILYDRFGLEEESQWSYELRLAIRDNACLQAAATQKRTDIAAKMFSIMQKEKALAHEEKLRLRGEKDTRKKARRLERRGVATTMMEESTDHSKTAAVNVDSRVSESDNTVSNNTMPTETAPEPLVRDKEKFLTKDQLKEIRAASAEIRSEEKVAEIKAARAKRKEAASEAKAKKAQKKAESIDFWQQKLGKHSSYTTVTPAWSSSSDVSSRGRSYAHGLDGLDSRSQRISDPGTRPIEFRNRDMIPYREEAEIY